MTTVTGQAGVDGARVAELLAQETEAFEAANPTSKVLNERACRRMVRGVPLHWMAQWPTPFPLYFGSAQGAHLVDVDLHEYADFCLGDTGAMFGHANPATVRAIGEQVARGSTALLPTEDAAWVGEELARRFGLPFWQMATSATDANRFAIRLARAITGRPKVLFHDHNYHGSVDESFAWLEDGRVVARRGNIGPPVDPAITTRIVPFNDLAALERELAAGDVAVAVMEPALTNVGIVLPEPGYLDGVRRLTRAAGTLLLIDETHTLCAGPGGATGVWGLEPDLLVVGKSIGGGIPCGTYGLSQAVADRVAAAVDVEDSDVGGIGGTLAGYALSMTAMRATLDAVLTPAAFERMIPLAERWQAGVVGILARHRIPWNVTRLGARAEYHFLPQPARDGAEQWAHSDPELERFLHLWAMNRGVLMTPFHNMALMCPATTADDVDRHGEVFEAAVVALFG